MKIGNIEDYFLPVGNTIEYKEILQYRVIFEYKKNNNLLLPEIYCFEKLEEAKNFSKTIKNYKYININAVLYHEGLYVENDIGKYIEQETNKRYNYKNIKIVTEVPVGDLCKKYYIALS